MLKQIPVLLVVLSLGFPLFSQLQVPGAPMEGLAAMKSANDIYLLPPLHPLEEDAFFQEAGELEARSKVGRFAVERIVDISPLSSGSWTVQGGYRVWQVHLISPGAKSIGLIFNSFRLEEGVRMMVYDPSREHVKGAYTELNNKSSGIFAVGHLPGEELLVELQVPESMPSYGKLELRSLSHALLPVALKGTSDERFGESKDCEIDISCSEGAAWQREKRSVVRIFTSTQYCTGVVVNNTASDGDPLVLTAKHCIDREYYAGASVFDFGYESPSCFGGDGSTDLSLSGADLLAVGDSIDFSLLRLSNPPPDSFQVSYAGWDLSQPGAGTTVIHHPEGDVKKISFDNEAPTVPSTIPAFPELLTHSFWWIKQWDVGSTEPGSSGSPLFNGDGRVIGLLSFGKAKCGDSIGYNSEINRVIYSKGRNIDDYFSRLSVAWSHDADPSGSLKTWLDPLSSGKQKLGPLDPQSVEPAPSESGQRIKLWPNPAADRVYVEALISLPGSSEYRIFDVNGRMVSSGEAELHFRALLQTGKLPTGLYLLEIRNGEFRETVNLLISK